jgi:exonuclease SbcD
MVISHGTVFNSISESGVPMAGTDHELGVDTLFASGADAVALGHIHKHQVWSQGTQKIAYAGSLGRFHYGEEGDKGWIMWSLCATPAGLPMTGEEGAHIDFVVTPSRRNIEFNFEGPPDIDAIKLRASECVGAFVRVRYSIDEEHRHGIDRAAIKEALAGAAELKIEGRVCIVQRQRAKGISTASMVDKLRLWAAATQTPGEDQLVVRLQSS